MSVSGRPGHRVHDKGISVPLLCLLSIQTLPIYLPEQYHPWRTRLPHLMIFGIFFLQINVFLIIPFLYQLLFWAKRDPKSPHVHCRRTEGKKGRTMERLLSPALLNASLLPDISPPPLLGGHHTTKMIRGKPSGDTLASPKHLSGAVCVLGSSCLFFPPPCLAFILFFTHIFLKLSFLSLLFHVATLPRLLDSDQPFLVVNPVLTSPLTALLCYCHYCCSYSLLLLHIKSSHSLFEVPLKAQFIFSNE